MKKIIPFLFTLFFSLSLSAQNEVTKFLGIPVDGTKSAMIQKLQAKGFRYNSTLDRLNGEFNGTDVSLSILTNNNKVWRIAIHEDYSTSSENSIKNRFNNLCRQFEKNEKYISATLSDQSILDSEDISFQMSVYDKKYQALYYQYGSQKTDDFSSMVDGLTKRSVWFQIVKLYGDYSIMIYYDNEFNHADGEDL